MIATLAVPDKAASTDAVVAWLLGAASLSTIDEDGRPLGEVGSPLYDRCPRREEHRSFGDSRDDAGLPMNTAALDQVQSVWPAVIEWVRGIERGCASTYGRLHRRALAATHWGRLCLLRDPTRPITRTSAALYKVNAGFTELFARLLIEEAIDADDLVGAPDEIFAWLDARPFLVGQRQVCAGSRASIKALYAALAGDDDPARGKARHEARWFADALAAVIELHALAAAGAGAARAYGLEGRLGAHAHHFASAQLLFAAHPPRWCATLRSIERASAAHTVLWFSSDRVPASLREFLTRLPEAASQTEPLAPTDRLLEEVAAPVAQRLVHALGRPSPDRLSVTGFLRSCA